MVIHTPSKASVLIFCRIYGPSHHPQGSVGWDMMYKWPWMGCHIFHMSCGDVRMVSHAWDVTYTQRRPPSRPHITKDVGQSFAGFANHYANPFHMSCGYVRTVSHVWDVTYTQRRPPSRPHITKDVGQSFAGFANHYANPREVWIVMRGSVTMDGLTYMSHVS